MPGKSIAGLEESMHPYSELPLGATVIRNLGQPGTAENNHQQLLVKTSSYPTAKK